MNVDERMAELEAEQAAALEVTRKQQWRAVMANTVRDDVIAAIRQLEDAVDEWAKARTRMNRALRNETAILMLGLRMDPRRLDVLAMYMSACAKVARAAVQLPDGTDREVLLNEVEGLAMRGMRHWEDVTEADRLRLALLVEAHAAREPEPPPETVEVDPLVELTDGAEISVGVGPTAHVRVRLSEPGTGMVTVSPEETAAVAFEDPLGAPGRDEFIEVVAHHARSLGVPTRATAVVLTAPTATTCRVVWDRT